MEETESWVLNQMMMKNEREMEEIEEYGCYDSLCCNRLGRRKEGKFF